MIVENNYYTVPKREDGFGAQYQYYIWEILYTELNGGKFVMPIIDKIEHNYDVDPTFIDKVRKFMNLENYYSNEECLKKNKVPSYLDIREGYKYVEDNIDRCLDSQTMRNLKSLFWINKSRIHIYDKNEDSTNYYNIAVHIRRSNNRVDKQTYDREVIDLQYYKNCIYEACEKYLFSFGLSKKKPIRIYIYSQGDEESFNELKEIEYGEVILKINDDMFESFTGMVGADVLILSASSYSYIAAFLSDGDIYYYPFWHNPSKKWNIKYDMKYIDLPGYTNWIKN